MDIYAISDLHLSTATDKPMDIFGSAWENYWEKIQADWHEKVGKDDLVLLSGDTSWGMTIDEAVPDLQQIAALPGKKVIIRGNHDYWWSSYSKVKNALAENMYAIQNNSLIFDNTIIAGTRGWSVPLSNADEHDLLIYQREQTRLKLSLDHAMSIRKNNERVILMLHYPPFNVTFADSELTKIISQYPVDTVVYGHLHGKDCRAEKCIIKSDIRYLLTSCDQIDNKLIKL